MKKIFYAVLLIALLESIAIVAFAFAQADAIRGYDATGGEVFLLALPITLFWIGILSGPKMR